MNVATVAAQLGTDPKTLRTFIRSNACPVEPARVGRTYALTPEDVAVIAERFPVWLTSLARCPRTVQRPQDAEPAPVMLPDIRDPRVRTAVREKAAVWDARLNERLLAAGLHVTQLRDRPDVPWDDV